MRVNFVNLWIKLIQQRFAQTTLQQVLRLCLCNKTKVQCLHIDGKDILSSTEDALSIGVVWCGCLHWQICHKLGDVLMAHCIII